MATILARWNCSDITQPNPGQYFPNYYSPSRFTDGRILPHHPRDNSQIRNQLNRGRSPKPHVPLPLDGLQPPGPYSQEGVWQISGAHNSGEASAINEVDLNGLVSGNALAFTWSNEFRPLSWGTLTVTGAGLPSTGLNFYTYDGIYQAYLPSTIGASGSVIYSFSLNTPGYAPQTWKGSSLFRPNRNRPEPLPRTDEHTSTRNERSNGNGIRCVSSIHMPAPPQTTLA